MLEPGEAISEEAWSHPSLECAFVVAGTLTVELDGIDRIVAAGEAISFDSRQSHRYRNGAGERVEFLISVAPPTP